LELDRLTRTSSTPGWTPAAARANGFPPPLPCANATEPDYCCWSREHIRCCCVPGCSHSNCARCARVGGVFGLKLDASGLEAPFEALVPPLARLVRFSGLRHVALMANNLTGSIPADTVEDLKGLITLDLGANGA
jgi:hypothetical protein